jgi:hypothetical protein
MELLVLRAGPRSRGSPAPLRLSDRFCFLSSDVISEQVIAHLFDDVGRHVVTDVVPVVTHGVRFTAPNVTVEIEPGCRLSAAAHYATV